LTARPKTCAGSESRPPAKPADATAVFEVTLDWMRELRRRIECRRLEDGDWPFLGALVSKQIAREENRQARMLAKVLEKAATNGATPADDPDESATAADGSATAGTAPQAGQAPGEGEPAETAEGDGRDPPADPKGHGRNGKEAYKNAQHFFYALALGVIGAVCEACGIGKMQAYREKVVIRIVGQPMLAAELHHYAQARCRNCGYIVRAEELASVFEGLGSDYIRYAWSACAMLAVMHYTSSSPFKRLESLHQGWGIPLADANQWELVCAGDDLLLPLYRAIERHAIQTATNFRIDDTGSMVIALQRQITAELAALESLGESIQDVRTGINATGLYWETPSGPVILFYTGRHHAGEIVDQVLRHRLVGSPKLVKCTDGASKNFDHQHADKLVESTCNAHALLKFRAIKDKHPAEYAEAGRIYKQVFDNDDKARDLTPIDRMRFHREHSKPLMEQLRKMCEQRLASKTVEPNSPLWEPLSFVINQWDRLTRFYKAPGVPLDTNLVEQALIIPVRYQAASFNYQTQDGALVGDHFMSLIATARANGVEPVAYLAECLRCHEDLAKRPEHYLPWAFAQRLKEGQVPAWPPQQSQREVPAPAPLEARPAPGYATLRHRAGKAQLEGSPPQIKTCSSRASSGEQVPSPVGQAVKRPFDKRFVHSQNPAPS
jgi:transposase